MMGNAINSRVNREIKELINHADCFCLENQEISKIENLQVFVQEDLSQIENIESVTFNGQGIFGLSTGNGVAYNRFRFSGTAILRSNQVAEIQTLPIRLFQI